MFNWYINMSTILLSFEPEWFDLIESGKKKFEYRKHFPKGETTVFFYVNAPVKGISGIARFAERECLEDWLKKYSDRPNVVQDRIKDFMSDCPFAMPLLRFQKTSVLHLEQIRKEYPTFIVPRMYYYIDDDPVLPYINPRLKLIGEPRIESIEEITDDDIC